MKYIKQIGLSLLTILSFALSAMGQSPIYLEIGDCVKELQYERIVNNDSKYEFSNYHFELNDYETIILEVSKYSVETLGFNAIRPYQITTCGKASLNQQLSVETVEKIQNGEQDIYVTQRGTNGYTVGKVVNATYMVYFEEDKYLRVIAADYSFDFDGNRSYHPGAELSKTDKGSFLFYTEQMGRCFQKTTFIHVPSHFTETSNMEFILGIGMVRQYSDKMKMQLVSIDGQDYQRYLTVLCNEEPTTYEEAVSSTNTMTQDATINMNFVDENETAEGWVEEEGISTRGGELIYKTTPVDISMIDKTQTEEQKVRPYKSIPVTYDAIVNGGVEEAYEMETENNQKSGVVITSEESYHIVSKGETLYGISNIYDISTLTLKSINDLESNLIRVGDKLKIKE